MTADLLLPCPFCSNTDIAIGRATRSVDATAFKLYVCKKCGAHVELPMTDKALHSWNVRIGVTALPESSKSEADNCLEKAAKIVDRYIDMIKSVGKIPAPAYYLIRDEILALKDQTTPAKDQWGIPIACKNETTHNPKPEVTSSGWVCGSCGENFPYSVTPKDHGCSPSYNIYVEDN